MRLAEFGDSSLDFELYFSCADILGIKDVMSDLRFSVVNKFKENHIVIPFPQRDINLHEAVKIEQLKGRAVEEAGESKISD